MTEQTDENERKIHVGVAATFARYAFVFGALLGAFLMGLFAIVIVAVRA